MFTLIVLGVIALFAWRYFERKKREAERRTWSVDFRENDVRPINRRLPWKDL
jgi:predicted negative regulator of RcsB-dependent stress response